jgi:hypothetical protein
MSRAPIPYSVQVEVFFRDKWLCSHCLRPTIFPLTLKLLSEVTAAETPDRPLAYWNPQWRRDAAPLLLGGHPKPAINGHLKTGHFR